MRADIPTEEVLALAPAAGEGILDLEALATERGWPVKILDSWAETQFRKGTLDCGVSSRLVWRREPDVLNPCECVDPQTGEPIFIEPGGLHYRNCRAYEMDIDEELAWRRP